MAEAEASDVAAASVEAGAEEGGAKGALFRIRKVGDMAQLYASICPEASIV